MSAIAQRLMLSVSLLSTTASVFGDVATFQMIPGARSANDMSPDGRFVVGELNAGGIYILDTTTNTMTTLPVGANSAASISDNGTVVLGSMYLPGTTQEVAAMWTATTGVWTSLGYLPNAGACPSRSNGYELSADGSVAVGLSWDGCSGRGFRWTQATGMMELQNLGNGNNRASVVSADGNVIGGFAQGSFSRTPTVWQASGSGQLIDPPNGDVLGEVHGINDAGTLLLGERNGKAATWTYPGLILDIVGQGSIIPGWGGIPMDISNDGTIVGFDFLSGNRRAWFHRAGAGPMIELKSYVNANGGNVPDALNLEVCQAISTDGSRIIGHTAFQGAWMVTIELTNCPADTNGDQVVNVTDLLAVIGAWGPCPNACTTPCPADVAPAYPTAHDCVVNVTDLLSVIGAWGACPPPVGGCCTGASCTQVSQAECVASGGVFLGVSVPCNLNACTNNDSCGNAINITASINGATVIGDNTTATPGIGGFDDPELPFGSPSCQFAGQPDNAHSTVWYSFVAPPNGAITITTCASTPAPFFDSTLALFSGTCGSLQQIACGEDNCDEEPQAPYYSVVSSNTLLPGATYYVCVMNPGSWGYSIPGPFVLTITSP